ncbi:MAG TPA: hypothetical protein VL068_13995 [Microthrixaceae bacterium]|nr:hypothetical protein [Microthrixaceae bacterium]
MNPSTLIFLGLAVVWVIVLLPEALRKLSATRSSDSIRTFNHQLSALHRSGEAGAQSAPGQSRAGGSNVINMNNRFGSSRNGSQSVGQRSEVQRQIPMAVRKRRQEVLTVLGSVAVLTLLCTVAFGPAFLVLHIIADVLLIAYVALVAQSNKAQAPSFGHAASNAYAPSADYGLRTATVRHVSPAPRRVAN